VTEPTSQAVESAWSALRRRKVVQWGLGYVAVAWGLLQGLEFAVATFRWPEVLTRVGAVIAVVGIPVTVTLAWYHGDRGEQQFRRIELVILAVIVVAGGFAVRQVALAPPASASVSAATAVAPTIPAAASDRRRLAVLPFENFGNDPANVAFASGVHDTLITQVAKVPGLSVISRSSVLQFEGRHPTIRDVAQALHVGMVLEGSVARDGNRLRIQAQLIDAATDQHLWAETYDRKADDLFAVQTDIAQAVAGQLRIRLTSGDAERLKGSLTSSPAAYDHYVLGRSHAAQGDHEAAIAEFTQAVTLDQNFAAAHAQLSMAYTWLGFLEPERRADSLPLADSEARRALAIDPTLPDAHLAQAVYYYRGVLDIERASREFERAIAGLPNDSQAHLSFGYLRRWQGRWEEGAALFKRAAELDPGGNASTTAAMSLAGLGRREEASAIIAAGLAARPDNTELAVLPGILAGDMDCDLVSTEMNLDDARRRFPNSPDPWGETWFFAWQTGDGPGALAAADRYAAIAGPEDESSIWRRANAELLIGRNAEARSLLRKSLDTYLRREPDVPPGDAKAEQLSWIAMHYSQLNERGKAIEYARRSIREFPEHGAMMQRTNALLFDAIALARAGDMADALPLIRESLELPGPRRAKGFWCDPLVAQFRTDPGFRALIAELGGDVSIDPTRRETWPKAPVH
jgi:TolB-like protein/Flp pilus assembly protein TadD